MQLGFITVLTKFRRDVIPVQLKTRVYKKAGKVGRYQGYN
jgi:hypothetical protein